LSFLVRILFSGLMVFVPNEDNTELTVLLLNVDHGYHTSDGSALPHHKSLLVTRGGTCTGTCPDRDADIAKFLFADSTLSVAQDSLEAAVAGGGAWELNGSQLSFRKGSTTDPDLPALAMRTGVRGTVNGNPQLVPTTATERGDFSWVANLKSLCSNCTVKSSMFDTQPPAIVAARLRLTSGNVFTYSLARIGTNVTPIRFERLDGTGNPSSYTQALASWVAADIEVSGSSIEIVESKFDGSTGRTMKLTPDANGKVEVAVLNVPPFVPPASSDNNAPSVGKHFEVFYETANNAPSQAARLVPRAGVANNATYPAISWSDVHPSTAITSELLNALRLDAGRTVYERTLCPPSQNPLP
jgi:hypothetical protein